MSDEKPNKRIKDLTRDTGLFALSTFGSKILVFLLTPLYTSILATEEYGIADLITATVNLVYPILTLAIAEATLRYSMEKNENKNKVFVNSIWFVVISTLLLLSLTWVSNYIYDEIADYWLVFVGIYFLTNIHQVLSNFLKGLGQTKLFAIQGLVQTLSIITCNILFLVVFKWGLKGYLLSIFVGYIIPSLLMFFFGKLNRYLFPLSIDWRLLKQMLHYCIPMIPTLVAWAINTNIDKFMIIGLCGLGESGIYGMAHKIPTLVATVLSVFTQAWLLSAINNKGDSDESEYYTSIYTALNIVSVLGCFAIIFMTKFLSGLLFAKDYYIAWKYVPFLTVSVLFSSNGGFISSAFKAAKKTNSLFYTVLIGSVVNVILNYALIKLLGSIGAAISTMVGFLVIWLFRIIMVQKIVIIRINVVHTIITYLSLIAAAIVICFNISYCYVIILGLCFFTIVVNYRDIKSIVLSVGRAINRIGNQKKYKVSHKEQ